MYIKRLKPPELIIQEMIDRLTPEERAELDVMEMTSEEAEMIIKKAAAVRRDMDRQIETILGK